MVFQNKHTGAIFALKIEILSHLLLFVVQTAPPADGGLYCI